MAENDKTQKAQGSKAKVTKNTTQYQTNWGPIYIPQPVVDAMGDPTNVQFTVTPAD